MGGFGSGRPGWKQKVEDTRSLDVTKLHRAGCLQPGYQGSWEWTRDGQRVANIGLQMQPEGLALSYRVRSGSADWESADYTVPLTWSACTKGGARPYFLCPGVRNGQPCGRRVAKLYSGGRYFLCRHCYQLTYQSRSEQPHDRLLRRANKLRQSMGGEPGTEGYLPPRRKGQWRKTHEAKLEQLWDLEEQANLHFARWIQQRFPDMPMKELLR